ncbi:MAG: DUF1573 domain-containing protein [Planctomycetes bacterium]|nr:DUF1573 domain-containing protein [Planctomycetota bacterium]
MRLPVIVVLLVFLGVAFGIARSWSELIGVEEKLELPQSVRVGDAGTAAESEVGDETGTSLAVVVGEAMYDVGVMKRDESRSHTFVVRNDGSVDLLIEKQDVSCGLCVKTQFERAVVKPGEVVEIFVTLIARKPGPELSEGLEVRTNDKTHEVIRLELTTYVTESAGASVNELALGTFSTSEGASATFNVYGFAGDQLDIVQCESEDQATKRFFELEVNDLSQDAAKAGQKYAKFGKEIKVTIKPGFPVGPLYQGITIVADTGEKVIIQIPLSGRVTGDLSLIGGLKYSPARSRLALGRQLAGEGASATLHLMVKGEHRDDVQLTVGECDPADYLTVTIGERKTFNDGNAYLIPLTVEVSKDTPVMNRLGGVQTPTGRIVLKTTHPTATEVVLYVRFAVE